MNVYISRAAFRKTVNTLFAVLAGATYLAMLVSHTVPTLLLTAVIGGTYAYYASTERL